MSNPNLGWLFYKDYFTAIKDWNNPKASEKDVAKKVDNLIAIISTVKEEKTLGNTHFKTTTTYPGLLLGSGNAHELPKVEGQAILGFHFDYTSGLPVIQGSSVKGVLRSAFKHWEYIAELTDIKSEKEVKSLESEIFDNSDIFFDAVIISEGKILGDDYLAPHGDDPLKNPIPLRFIKVMPNVTFMFDFELSDGILLKDDKRILFQTILEDLGLGAKTNVGYGKFENFSTFKTQEERALDEKALALKKEQDEAKRVQEIEDKKNEKAQKAKEGVTTLLECKTLKDGFALLKDSFGKVPKPTNEQKEIIEKYYKKQKNLSKAEKKLFKKYGVS